MWGGGRNRSVEDYTPEQLLALTEEAFDYELIIKVNWIVTEYTRLELSDYYFKSIPEACG